ncbi:MAG: phage tail protein [Proteobacteria bacterium]|nr:phage tail protein [Pseudomonadota bacterium]
MAQSKEYQRSHYPLMVYNFRVTVGGTTMGFSEVSGLNREYETVTYKHGFSYWEGEEITKYRYDKYVSVTLKRGTVKGVSDLYDWLEGKDKRVVEVNLCDEQGTPIVRWHIAKAIPIKLEAPTFDANSNDVSIETLELMAAGISLKNPA